MNESSFIKSIHIKLPRSIYKWKINDSLTNGVADAYYSAKGGDLWVEYKYIPTLPKRESTLIKTCLTEQQALWLNARSVEGRSVALVIGSPDGCLILDTAFNRTFTKDEFIRTAKPLQSVIDYIKIKTEGVLEHSPIRRRSRPRYHEPAKSSLCHQLRADGRLRATAPPDEQNNF